MPSTYSVSNLRVLLSSTVMTPSLPTLSITSAISLPISSSAAEMAATWAISVLLADRRRQFFLRLLDDRLDAALDAALEQQRVGAGGDVLEALVDDRLGQHGGGGGAVAGDVVGLGGGFLEQLGAHVLERVFELDLLGDGHAVVGDRRRAELLVEHHVAALGAERDLDGVGQRVDAALERAARVLAVLELLGRHRCAEPP